jgi:hypothetical protein
VRQTPPDDPLPLRSSHQVFIHAWAMQGAPDSGDCVRGSLFWSGSDLGSGGAVTL